MTEKEKIKQFVKLLLATWGVQLADFMLKPIYDKIEGLSDDKIRESINLMKKTFEFS